MVTSFGIETAGATRNENVDLMLELAVFELESNVDALRASPRFWCFPPAAIEQTRATTGLGDRHVINKTALQGTRCEKLPGDLPVLRAAARKLRQKHEHIVSRGTLPSSASPSWLARD